MSKLAIVSWNIQSGRGADGRVDLDRIAATVRRFGAPDIICFQEVARHMPGVTGGADIDQARALTDIFSGYQTVFRPSVDVGRHQFGCMVLSRHPVLQVRNHLLPRPNVGELRSMQRQALEVTVDIAGNPLRVTTTHLEFHSPRHQIAQAERLREIHREASQRTTGAELGMAPGETPYFEPPAARDAVGCGDFNFLPRSAAHQQIIANFTDDTPPLHDAWATRYGDLPHPDTCGIADGEQWPQGGHCRDFFFVAGGLAKAISAIEVDQETRASDHQPIRIVFDR